MSWTEDRVNLLKKLWGEGRTAAEIASELGGVTRNAVIGKAHRLKLSGRVSPIQQNKKSAEKSAPKKAREQSNKKPVEALKKTVAVSEECGKYSLEELAPGMCRWPSGDPKSGKFGFCGAKTIAGLPYCREHVQVAYQPATRKRILKAEDAQAEAVSQAEIDKARKLLSK